MSAGNRPGRITRVMERLTQDHEIDGTRGDGRLFHVAESELQVLEPDPAGLGRAKRNDLFGIVNRDDLLAPAREQFAQEPLAGTEIRHGERWQDAKEEMSKGLPGTAGTIDSIEASGDLIEQDLGLVGAKGQDTLEVDAIGVLLGELRGGTNGEVQTCADVVVRRLGPTVERALSFAPRFEKAGLQELTEVGGDAGLAHARDFLEFLDAEFVVLEESDDAETCGIGEGTQRFEGGGHEKGLTLWADHISSHPDTSI